MSAANHCARHCATREVIRQVAARLRETDASINTTDGVRVTRPDGWWLLRASGTEPKLTARCEASDENGLDALTRELEHQLALSELHIQLRG